MRAPAKAAAFSAVAVAVVTLVSADRGAARVSYDVGERQAREVSVAVRFIDAFNGRRLEDALALLAADARVSDCDYRQVRAVSFYGRNEIGTWLRQRFADHDYLGLERVWNENPAQATGVLGLTYEVRENDTLRALGFPTGVRPRGATKILFSKRPVRIAAFANGPFGGSPEACRPG